MRPAYGPLECVCVRIWEREWVFPSLYFGELERRLSASLFPTNQVLPTCQPRRDARPFKTLLINKPPMHPFRFYSASTSAIETPEKKNDIIVSLSGSLHIAHSLNRCVCCVVCMRVNRKRCAQSSSHRLPFFFFSWKCWLCISALACVDIGKASCILSGSWKAWIVFPPS